MTEVRDKRYMSWDWFDRTIEAFAEGHEGEYINIIAVSRGGLVPAVALSHRLNIPFFGVINVASYEGQERRDITQIGLHKFHFVKPGDRTLIVDDIVDTGATLIAIREVLCLKCDVFALVLTAPRVVPVTWYGMLNGKGDWIVFPWENTDV